MENGNEPINPLNKGDFDYTGLTKREYACIKLGVPDSGCDEIDAIIIKAERKRLAGLALQGLMANESFRATRKYPDTVATNCLEYADELLKQLDKE